VGRHFRLGPQTKLIVGRNERDNRVLAQLAIESDILLETEGGGSPLSILRGEATEEMIRLAAAITRRYSKRRNDPDASVRVCRGGSNEIKTITPDMISDEAINPFHVG